METTMGQEAGRSYYQRYIAERMRDVDPRHVEAWMRIEHPTLDGLSRVQFIAAMHVALGCAIDAGPEASEALAVSFGL